MKIQSTVGVLTFNSAITLRRALESVRDFDEIIICDGGSTDSTLDIAREFGALVVIQDTKYKNHDGSLKDFSGVRNQMLDRAKHDWFFFVDSDEYISDNLNKEIAIATNGKPKIYWINRLYVYKDVVIECSAGYPNRQPRLFHRSVVNRFIKPIHERIEPKVGIAPSFEILAHVYVPLIDDLQKIHAKWLYYIGLEKKRQDPLTFRRWSKMAMREGAIAGLYILRYLRIVLLCKKPRLPARIDLARVWYQYKLTATLFSNVRSL